MIRVSQPPPARAPNASRGGTWIVAAVILVALVLAAVGFGLPYFYARGGSAAGERIEASVAGVRLNFESAMARFAGELHGGAVDAIDLAALFPEFSPAGVIDGLTPTSDLIVRHERTVFITVTAAGNGLDPSERTAKLYARFLEPEEWSHPGGLTMRRFMPGSPFEGEDLYLTPPEGKVFSARCMRPAASPDGLPDACLHDFRLGALNVQLRFSPARLADWESLTQGARALVGRMRR